MNAPAMNPDLQFSQSSLQDFVDCQRRFQLRYLLRLAWPAVESEPVMENERHMRMGAQFQQMTHQHLLGVPSERLANMLHDEILLGWWENYQAFLAYREELAQAGFEAEDFGSRAVRLVSVPVELGEPLAARSFRDALDVSQGVVSVSTVDELESGARALSAAAVDIAELTGEAFGSGFRFSPPPTGLG